MGLRATLAKAVASAFTAIGDIPESCTYRRTSSAYNTSTGTNVVTNTDYTIAKAVFLAYESMEIDKVTILASDQKFLIQASSLPVASVNIATDQIIDSSGKIFNILRISKDPAEATIKLQLRSPS